MPTIQPKSKYVDPLNTGFNQSSPYNDEAKTMFMEVAQKVLAKNISMSTSYTNDVLLNGNFNVTAGGGE